MAGKTIRIGGASAFIVDSAAATPQLLGEAQLDYLVYDYLAEGSMGMLARFQATDPGGGFAPDFISVHIGPHLPEILRRGVKVVANARGLRLGAAQHRHQPGQRHLGGKGAAGSPLSVTVRTQLPHDVWPSLLCVAKA